MKLFTSKTRTINYIRELKKGLQKHIEVVKEQKEKCEKDPEYLKICGNHIICNTFPTNQKGDMILIMSPTAIYHPYIDQEWEGGGHVAKSYFLKGLEFLTQKAVKITGESNINYYNPSSEKDLKIKYLGEIPDYQLKIMTKSACFPIKLKSNINSRNEFDKKVAHLMHIDAYEFGLFVGNYCESPSYIWLPHPDNLNQFKDILCGFVPDKKRRNILEKSLDHYYS